MAADNVLFRRDSFNETGSEDRGKGSEGALIENVSPRLSGRIDWTSVAALHGSRWRIYFVGMNQISRVCRYARVKIAVFT